MQKHKETDIAKRAYAIWEQEGHLQGYDLDHWLRAERELERSEKPDPVKKPAPRRSVKRSK